MGIQNVKKTQHAPIRVGEQIRGGAYNGLYKSQYVETGEFVALKLVEEKKTMNDTIRVLDGLNHQNVVEFKGLVCGSKKDYLAFEFLEHNVTEFNRSLTEPEVKYLTHQILIGLSHCHDCDVIFNGLKGSNVLLNDQGVAKIAYFEHIFSSPSDKKQGLRKYESTSWYPPELLVGGAEDGVGSVMWSLGCILGKLIFPNIELKQEKGLAEILKEFPEYSLPLFKILFAEHPDQRGTPTSHLHSEFFTTNLVPCPLPNCSTKLGVQRQRDARRKVQGGHAFKHIRDLTDCWTCWR